MTQATTLRAVVGLPAEPHPLKDSALVLIDCQNTYRQGTLQLTGVEEALAEAQRLLAAARDAGIPVFHIQQDDGPGSLFDINADIGRIAEAVAPGGNEPVVVKNYPNSFVGTDLHERLQAIGATNLVLAGFMTHMCVNSTARGAFNLGYNVTVVAGATATRDLPKPSGGVVPAQSIHDASLASIADLFAVVVARTKDLAR
ncbi:MAG: cysteine hydrolase [Burkholderiales bacterium]|nr:cysteine hydrolase [Burkholderiales bacterium]